MGKNYCDFKGRKNPNYKTGYAVKGKRLGFYNTWQSMKARCLNPNHPKYKNYGGRGIKVCEDWIGIEGFSKWALSSGWKKGMSIDRVDNDGNYEPKNCLWVSMSENSRKKSTTKITKDQAEEIRKRIKCGENERDLAKEYGVVHGTIWYIKKNITHVKDGDCFKKIKKIREKNVDTKTKTAA